MTLTPHLNAHVLCKVFTIILYGLDDFCFSRRADFFPGERGYVASIVDGDTVAPRSPINGANQIRLFGLQAPKLPLGRRGFKAWPLGEESKLALERLVLGKTITLKYGGRRMDRH